MRSTRSPPTELLRTVPCPALPLRRVRRASSGPSWAHVAELDPRRTLPGAMPRPTDCAALLGAAAAGARARAARRGRATPPAARPPRALCTRSAGRRRPVAAELPVRTADTVAGTLGTGRPDRPARGVGRGPRRARRAASQRSARAATFSAERRERCTPAGTMCTWPRWSRSRARLPHAARGACPTPLLALFQPSGGGVPVRRRAAGRTGRSSRRSRAPVAVVAAHLQPELPWDAARARRGSGERLLRRVRVTVAGDAPRTAPTRTARRDPILALPGAGIVLALNAAGRPP